MKFWQKKKTFDISETDQVYKVIYLGNVVTSYAKGEHTLEKPLTALWRNYCNNYANYHIKNNDTKKQRPQNKQILMKLTICNQGLKALTREFGLTEYWANRITFCGQNSNFPRVFSWIYRHEAKQKKQELRVHACFVNSQSSVNKMISTLQQKINFALNEFKREKRLKENARKIISMSESFSLDDDIQDDKTDSKFFNEFVDRLYNKMNGETDSAKLKDDSSINSSEQMDSANTSKNSTLDSKRITRNPSQGSLNSIKSKSSTSSKRTTNYDSNLMPARRQFLVKGLKNFKEPIERSRSAPKLCSIDEELFVSSDEEEDENYFGKLLTNYYNICEEEPDDEEIIRELGLISSLNEDEHDEINESDKTLTEFNENDHFNYEFKTIYEEEKKNHVDNQTSSDLTTTSECSSDEDKTIESIICNGKLSNGNLSSSDKESIEKHTDQTDHTNNLNELNKTTKNEINNQLNDEFKNQINVSSSTNKLDQEDDQHISVNKLIIDDLNENQENNHINNNNQPNKSKNDLSDRPKDYVYDTCQSPQFIIFKRTNSFNNRECELHENVKLIENLVLNF